MCPAKESVARVAKAHGILRADSDLVVDEGRQTIQLRRRDVAVDSRDLKRGARERTVAIFYDVAGDGAAPVVSASSPLDGERSR